MISIRDKLGLKYEFCALLMTFFPVSAKSYCEASLSVFLNPARVTFHVLKAASYIKAA